MLTDANCDPLIEANKIGVKRNGRWLIRNITMAVRRGEIVTIIGPNGGGKTTTVKSLLGLIALDEGRVTKRRGLKIGYIPQQLTINWTLPLAVKHLLCLTNNYTGEEIAASLAKVDMAGAADKRIKGLSGGELQRVLLARTLFANPDLLILDEPLQGVDFSGVTKFYRLIKEIRDNSNCGILLISHDLNVVMAQTDQVICLNRYIRCSGLPHVVADSSQYQQLFGASPALTLALYKHGHENSHKITSNTAISKNKENN